MGSISTILHNAIEKTINEQVHAFISIGEELNETINGNRFIVHELTTLAAGASIDIGIATPSDCDIRLTGFELTSDVNFVEGILYEDATFTGSTELEIINSNRQSENEANVIIYSAFSVAPIISSAKEIDIVATLGGDGFRASTGSADSGDGFFILKKDTKHIVRISNESTDSANVLIKIPFIETDLSD